MTSIFVVVMPNGMVLSGLRSELTFDQGVRQRRLTEDGLDRLAAMVDAAIIEHCQPVANDNPDVSGSLSARTEDEPVVAWFGGMPLSDVRRRSPVEISSIATLFERLRDLDAALGPSSWRDEARPPYVPEQWKLTVRLVPNGSDLRRGVGCHRAASRWHAATVVRQMRPCRSRAGRDAARFPGPTASEGFFGGGYERTFTGFESEAMTVRLTGVLPGDPGCEQTKRSKPSEPPPDLAPEIDACDLLRDVVPDMPNDNVGVGFLPMRGGGEGWWTGCIAWPDPGDLGLYIRGQETCQRSTQLLTSPPCSARLSRPSRYSAELFYWNDCFSDESDCTPAAAVVSEPHLVRLLVGKPEPLRFPFDAGARAARCAHSMMSTEAWS